MNSRSSHAPNSVHSGADEEYFKDSDSDGDKNTEDGFELCGAEPADEPAEKAAPTVGSVKEKAPVGEVPAPEEPQPIPFIGVGAVGLANARTVPDGHSSSSKPAAVEEDFESDWEYICRLKDRFVTCVEAKFKDCREWMSTMHRSMKRSSAISHLLSTYAVRDFESAFIRCDNEDSANSDSNILLVLRIHSGACVMSVKEEVVVFKNGGSSESGNGGKGLSYEQLVDAAMEKAIGKASGGQSGLERPELLSLRRLDPTMEVFVYADAKEAATRKGTTGSGAKRECLRAEIVVY